MSNEFDVEQELRRTEGEGEAPRPPIRYDQSWLASLLRPALIVLLIATLDITLGVVVARFAQGTPPGFAVGLVVIAVAAAIIGVTTTTVLAQPSQRVNRRAATRAAEIGLILVAVRLYVWLAGSGLPSLREMLEAPLETLVDMLFLVCATIVGLSWFLATEVAGDLGQLALTPDEIRTFERRSDRGGDSMRGTAVDRRMVLNGFTMRWATLGLVLIILAAVARRNLTANGFRGLFRQDTEPAVMVAVVLYFLVGLLLISHGQLALLRARWTLEQTPSDGSVTRRWPVFVIILLLAIGATAAFLPLGGTFLLAVALSAVIGAFVAAGLFVQRLVLLAIAWLASLFASNTPAAPLPPPPPPAQTFQDLPASAQIVPTWVGGSLFWVAIAALVAYAAWVYFHDRGIHWRWLRWLVDSLRRRYADARRVLWARRPQMGENGADYAGDGPRWSLLEWWRRGPHGPDEEVRYLYLAALERANEAGVGRMASETPDHYAPRLEAAVAETEDAAAAAHALTVAFVEVRYARRHAAAERVTALRAGWEALRAALRR